MSKTLGVKLKNLNITVQEIGSFDAEELSNFFRLRYDEIYFVSTIRRKLRNNNSIPFIASFIKSEFLKRLFFYFKEEEAVYFPFLKNYSQIRIVAEEHHRQLRILSSIPLLLFTERNIVDFANILEAHIEFEERTLFPLIDNILISS